MNSYRENQRNQMQFKNNFPRKGFRSLGMIELLFDERQNVSPFQLDFSINLKYRLFIRIKSRFLPEPILAQLPKGQGPSVSF
jgi:hypothetical protein